MATKVTDKDGNEFDLEALVQGMIASKGGGDASKALGLMIEENHDLRGKNRDLKTQLDKANVPEGSVLLSKDETTRWNVFKDLKPEEVTKKLTERDELEVKYNGLVREGLVRNAADVSSMKYGVLNDLVSAKSLDLVIGEAEVDDGKGGKVKQPAAFVKDANGQQKLLVEVVRERFTDYIPALQLESTNGNSKAGTPWVSQQPVGGSDGKTSQPNVAQSYISKVYGAKEEAGASK